MPNAYDAVEMKTSREEVSADETVCVDVLSTHHQKEKQLECFPALWFRDKQKIPPRQCQGQQPALYLDLFNERSHIFSAYLQRISPVWNIRYAE